MYKVLVVILGIGLAGLSLADDESTEDLRAFERRVLDADSRPPELRMEGIACYSTNRLDFALNNGLAMTRGGRIWASWISGGDGPKSFTVANWSDDGGETWTDTKLVIDGHDGSKSERTNIIGTFWLDPDGKLRCYTDQSVLHFDGRAGIWESICENPDAAKPVWSKARRIGNGHVINKPIVLRTGEWVMPAYLNGTWSGKGTRLGAFKCLDAERGATCFVSVDRGKTWQKRATVKFPATPVEDWQESQLLELKDGTLRMFARVIDGGVGCLMAADSKDGGRTFDAPRRLRSIDNTNARFQIQRLKSGNLIFVKHGVPDAFSMAWCGRRQLTAYLSDDDGASWKGGLVLDWGNGSYPDLFQSEDGYICVSHDHARATMAEIWLHRFTEADILARRIVSPKGKLNILVMRAMQSEYNLKTRFGARFEIADRAVTGAVTVINIPWAFKDGKINWLFNPTLLKGHGPVNHEWLWQLNRMHFWSEMGKVYRATKDEKYARAFAAQLAGWLDQTGGVPPEKMYNSAGSPFRTIEEGIRLMLTWPNAWDDFGDSPAFTPELKNRFLEAMRVQARHLMAHRTCLNHLLMEMNGVYTFAVKFPEFPECADLRKASVRIFTDAFKEQILPDGLHNELTPDYHCTAYWCAMPLYETARKFGTLSDLPKDYLDTLRLGAEGPIAMMTPCFTEPRFNDSFTLTVPQALQGVHKYFPERRDLLWAATEGCEGAPPKGATASRFLPWSGFAVMRSGWDRDATYLCFDVGPLGASTFHAHQDKLSFNLYKGGEELVFEDGGGQYEQSAERVYGTSGYDHNTLLVDGLAQHRFQPLKSLKPIDALWETTPTRDRAFGVYDQGFGPRELRLATHRREIVFDKKADLFTLTDDVTSADGSNHVYQLLFQLPTTTTEILDGGTRLIARYGRKVKGKGDGVKGNANAWNLEISVKGGTITTASAQKKPRLAGWFIGRNDRATEPATTVFVTAPKTKDWQCVTTLKPVRSR